MYVLYIANKNYSSWSLRPWILMRELGIAFEERLVPFEPTPVQKAFRAFSPTGKVPCLIDGETRVWDSLAITEYLAERQLDVWPANPDARAWARCAVAEMHSGFTALRVTCSMTCGVRIRLNQVSEALANDLERLEELWTEGLERFGGPFLAGKHFTAVDAFFAPIAFRVQSYSLKLFTRSAQYVARMLEVAAMRTWYAEALAETWRDPPHDEEILKYGKVLKDLRASAA
ncbi:MAG TPA: glutathione S-transferase family protein [Steroidobacteraceae bacterium]|jgi:glutathione S-transferase|nr:glutathione S-transferase family protein [Steroidobacteraceae bacterium]